MPDTLVNAGTLKAAVQLACRAPSLHNSQPWNWATDGAKLHLHLDRSRVLHSTDTLGREAYISCGAVLDHLKVAMAAAGWASDINRFPTPSSVNHLASIDFRPIRDVTDRLRDRAEAIEHRRTNRLPFTPPKNWESLEAAIRNTTDDMAVHLDVVATDLRPEFARVSELAESLRLYNSPYHNELDWWTGHFEDSDGIPRSSLVSAAENDLVDIGRTFPVTAHNTCRTSSGEDRSTVLVLSTDHNTRNDALRCGEALSAVLLECTLARLATCTVTHLTELQSSRSVIGSLTGREAMPQLLIRVGETPDVGAAVLPMTPRRPLQDVLTVRTDTHG